MTGNPTAPTTRRSTRRSIGVAIREVVTYNELLLNLTRRELRSRFRRSFLGWGWSFMQPVLMTAVYALVLGQFFKATPTPGDPSGIDTFVFFLLAGVVPWSLFAGGLGAGVGSVANAGGLITRVWFPRELLPMSAILALAFSALIEFSVLAAVISVYHQVFLIHLLPVLLVLVVLQTMFTAGIAFWLAACNVKFKDVEYLTSVFLLAYFYLTPVLYPPTFIPEKALFGTSLSWRDVALANPMARFVMAYRNLLYDVRLPGFETMVWLIGWSFIAFFLGLRFFARRADYFAVSMPGSCTTTGQPVPTASMRAVAGASVATSTGPLTSPPRSSRPAGRRSATRGRTR
jgi:lipopolysaccharide transport system permease protein